jgi:hypothetical protein
MRFFLARADRRLCYGLKRPIGLRASFRGSEPGEGDIQFRVCAALKSPTGNAIAQKSRNTQDSQVSLEGRAAFRKTNPIQLASTTGFALVARYMREYPR